RIDAVGKHMAMVSVAGDHAVLGIVEGRLKPDSNRLLSDVEMAEAPDETESVELSGLLLEPANERHLLVEVQEFVLGGLVPILLGEGVLQAVQRELVLRLI